jgi:hypothetical protein
LIGTWPTWLQVVKKYKGKHSEVGLKRKSAFIGAFSVPESMISKNNGIQKYFKTEIEW